MAFFGRRPQKPGSVPGAGSGVTPPGTQSVQRQRDSGKARQERAGRNIRNARNERRAR